MAFAHCRIPPCRMGSRLRGPPVANPLLEVDGLSKRFGGIIASNDIKFQVQDRELLAIIGPNGAGNTTLPTHRRSALGLARSFQITSLFLDFTVLDNVALVVQAHAGHSFRFWR